MIWTAAVHDDHTDTRHIHALAAVQGRLERDDLARLREATTQACLEQQRERDLLIQQHARAKERAWEEDDDVW